MKTNTLYAGDCLDRMGAWPAHCVDLIYLDPPFNSKANYNILFGKGRGKNRKDDLAQMTAFTDTWQWDADAAERVNHMILLPRQPHQIPNTIKNILAGEANSQTHRLSGIFAQPVMTTTMPALLGRDNAAHIQQNQ